MTTLKNLVMPIAILSLSLTLATSCNDTKDSKEVAEEANDQKFDNKAEKDADVVVNSYSANMFEIKAAEQAAASAVTPEVKELATMLVSAHTKMNSDVAALASGKHITLPTALTDDQNKDLEKLAEKKGIDYDKAFTEKMKDKHEDAVKNYEKAADKCEDTEIKMWATATIPEVKSHLDMVKSTWESIKDKK